MGRRTHASVLCVALAAAARVAGAQDAVTTAGAAAPEVRAPAGLWGPATGVGTAVLLGGGVTNFIGQGARATTGIGGSWDVRVATGTRRVLGAELAYVGGINPVTGPDVDIDADDFLFRNGAEAVLRLSFPIASGARMLAPFAFGGIGWNRYNLINDEGPPRANVREDDDMLVVPLGAGLAGAWRGVMLDLRGTWRAAFDDEMFGEDDMRTWGVQLGLGGEF